MFHRLIELLKTAWQMRVTQYAENRIVTTTCRLCKQMTPHSYKRHLEELSR
jgi:hypothetical protein